MEILNSHKKRFKLDRDRPLPLAIDQRLQEKMDKDENLCNGEPLSVLGCFDITESQFERVNYSPLNPVLQKITPRNDITSIHIEKAYLRLMLTL